MKFGDPVTNTLAGDGNPTKHGFFVREYRRTGRLNPGSFIEVTDGKGKFWDVNAAAIVPTESRND